MNRINNFKELEKKELERYANLDHKEVHTSINNSIGLFQFIGSMTELFFSKFIGAAIGSHLSEPSEKSERKPIDY